MLDHISPYACSVRMSGRCLALIPILENDLFVSISLIFLMRPELDGMNESNVAISNSDLRTPDDF